jgi:Calpain family cysteine protease/Ubiquitin interaction motif
MPLSSTTATLSTRVWRRFARHSTKRMKVKSMEAEGSYFRMTTLDHSLPPNCRCKGSAKAKLGYKQNEDGLKQQLRPFFACATKQCQYFSWAYQTERLQWYRFGSHTGHTLVLPSQKNGPLDVTGHFSANDLCQGRVGDCWFLSALAVVAERPDLIRRLFGNGRYAQLDESGVVQVNLFLDGFWKTVVVDNFLPCLVDASSEMELQQALQASLAGVGSGAVGNGVLPSKPPSSSSTSKFDPYALADQCRDTLRDTNEFLEQHQRKTLGKVLPNNYSTPLQRPVTSLDLAYSKAKKNQLWVPFLEKAYAKSHGSYSAISGGHIAEAFLDLTGAPTLVYSLHSRDFEPRSFWYKLLQYRRQQLPMGCGTDSSAVGIIGMHAYSILDVQEIKNVPFSFFQETGVAHGNVSGFTDYDGTVRLIKIRNPHGKGEWKGDFSDKSQVWEKLLQQGVLEGVTRSMQNDGTFFIDYDNFLLGFSNVDVVLAFLGNHAKSIPSNFPAKKSNHRCTRAFEVSMIDPQPGLPTRDTVELYIMGLQKTRRGASSGRVDRKKSYKVCDLGMLVGEGGSTVDENDQERFSTVHGEMFGFRRDGHYRLVLNRKTTRRMVVMPTSFGHPAATDKDLPFVLRFVSDAPLMIRELPNVPRMDAAFQTFCLQPPPVSSSSQRHQGVRKVVLEEETSYRLVQVDCRGNHGGVVFLYLCIAQNKADENRSTGLSFSVEANCRGMSCRTENGLLDHDTVTKGKKFEASWRQYSTEFIGEDQSRLLLVLYQSGQDTEFGSIKCKRIPTPRKMGSASSSMEQQATLDHFLLKAASDLSLAKATKLYDTRGIFHPMAGNDAFELSGKLPPAHASLERDMSFHQAVDDELERALALSRGDVELQQALEMSRNNPLTQTQNSGHHDDTALRQVLELSRNEAKVTQYVSIDDDSDNDDDLAQAIKLSLASSYQPPLQDDVVVDLSDTPGKRKRDDCDMCGGDTKPTDLAEKRLLVAEAALARMRQL